MIPTLRAGKIEQELGSQRILDGAFSKMSTPKIKLPSQSGLRTSLESPVLIKPRDNTIKYSQGLSNNGPVCRAALSRNN